MLNHRLKGFVADLCFVAEWPDVRHFLDLTVYFLGLARVHQRWDVALKVVFAAQELSFAREQSDTCLQRAATGHNKSTAVHYVSLCQVNVHYSINFYQHQGTHEDAQH